MLAWCAFLATLLDINISQNTLITVALVLFIVVCLVWLISWLFGRFHRGP